MTSQSDKHDLSNQAQIQMIREMCRDLSPPEILKRWRRLYRIHNFSDPVYYQINTLQDAMIASPMKSIGDIRAAAEMACEMYSDDNCQADIDRLLARIVAALRKLDIGDRR